jgi:hypothetical protein
MRFRARTSDLDPLDAASVSRWTKRSDESLGSGLDADQRRTLAGLLVEVWQLEHPDVSFEEDVSNLVAIDHLPEFVPAPSYEWGKARHPESGVLFWWTRADPYAELETQRPFDPYEPIRQIDVEEGEHAIVLELGDGGMDDARIEITRHAIVLMGNDDDPPFLVRAILAFTGWAAARPSWWHQTEEGVHLVGEILPCARCGEPRETGFGYLACCDACGERRVGLAVDA